MEHPLHHAIKKRMAMHEELHGPAEGEEHNAAPIPAHGASANAPEAHAEAIAGHDRGAIEQQGLEEHQSPEESGAADDRHGMLHPRLEGATQVPDDMAEDESLFQKMFQDHGNEVPEEHGRSLTSKVKHHVAKHILHRGVESAAKPRHHMGSAAMKKHIDHK